MGQKECLRWSNGTQTFEVDAQNVNITQTDYAGNDNCGKGETLGKANPTVGRKYIMQNMRCYELYGNRAFSWTTTQLRAAVSAGMQRGAISFGLCYLLVMVSVLILP